MTDQQQAETLSFLYKHVPGLAVAEHAGELRQSLADVLTLARLKWGNLDADANKVFEHAESLLAQTAI